MCLGVSICGYVHVSAGSCEGQKRALVLLEVQVVLGIDSGSRERAPSDLHH